MVPRASLHRAAHRVGDTVLVVCTLVMAMMTWALYQIHLKQAAILHVLNGGCLP